MTLRYSSVEYEVSFLCAIAWAFDRSNKTPGFAEGCCLTIPG
jgi:hypothetical protein